MGCFRSCLSLSKSRKLGKSAIKTSLRDHIKKPAEAKLDKYANTLDIPFKFAVNSSSPTRQNELENAHELLSTTARKKVTFDLVIKDNDIDLIQRSSATIYPADKLDNDTDHGIPFKQNAQQQEHSWGIKKVNLDPAIKANQAESAAEINDRLTSENTGEKSCGEKDKVVEIEKEVRDLLVTKALPYPANHRYGNCNTNYEESEDREFDENNFDEDDERNNDQNETVIPSESSGSLFSLSIDFNAQGSVHENEENEVISAVKMSDFPDLEVMKMDRVNQNDQVLSHCVDSVLNPVENPSLLVITKIRRT